MQESRELTQHRRYRLCILLIFPDTYLFVKPVFIFALVYISVLIFAGNLIYIIYIPYLYTIPI